MAPRIAIIIGTTREGRFGNTVARWALAQAAVRGDASVEIVDLRDHPLPFFAAPRAPSAVPVDTPEAKRWSETIAAFDGYVFVTAEYNHSISGVLKNAIDHLYPEVRRKPATFIGYGGQGGTRAVEHLRNILAELQVATLRFAVHIGRSEILAVREGKTLDDFPALAAAATAMLDELVWWTETLTAGRQVRA